MKEHRRKKTAVIVITAVFVIYYAVYFGSLSKIVPGVLKILMWIIPLVIGGAMLYVCRERIKEIDGGEEDDLGKY